MKKTVYGLVFGLLLAASPALAASADGTWSGSVATPDGDVQVTFTFKTEGSKLTGTTTGPDGAATAIDNGKVEGDKISFTVDLDIGMPITLNYSGVVAADKINMTIDFMGMPLEFVLSKK